MFHSNCPVAHGQLLNTSHTKNFPRLKLVQVNISHHCPRKELLQNLLIFLTQNKGSCAAGLDRITQHPGCCSSCSCDGQTLQQTAESSVRARYLGIFPSGNWPIRPIGRLVTTSARLILGERKPQLNPVQDSVGLAVESAALFFSDQDESQRKRKGVEARNRRCCRYKNHFCVNLRQTCD